MQKAKILVVDDDPRLSRLVKIFLERTSLYQVAEENRSCQAVQTARKLQPSLIILDINMPDKDGGEVALDLSSDPLLQNCPVLFLTSLISPAEAVDREVLHGEHPFLSKPVNPHDLVAAVGRLLERDLALVGS